MTTLAAPAAADQAVFRFTVPLSAQELLTLTGLGETWRTRRDTRGWALLDARGRVWGWHPFDTDDLDWCDAPSALAAFIVKPHVRPGWSTTDFTWSTTRTARCFTRCSLPGPGLGFRHCQADRAPDPRSRSCRTGATCSTRRWPQCPRAAAYSRWASPWTS